MPNLSLPDIALHFEVTGNGPPLLMLAGMLSDSASWAPLLPLLEPHFTLIRPDNRTTGRTTPWDAPASVEHFANDAVALLDHLEIAQCHVLGHSMGGLIALNLAQNHPNRVASLTTAGTAPIRLARNVELFETLVTIRRSDAPSDTWLRTLFPWLFAPSVYDTPEAVAAAAQAAIAYPFAQSTEAMAHQIKALSIFDVETLKPPGVPTQALLAQNDLLIPIDLAKPAWGDTPLQTIQNAGHSIHWDAPHSVAEHLLKFTTTHPITGET